MNRALLLLTIALLMPAAAHAVPVSAAKGAPTGPADSGTSTTLNTAAAENQKGLAAYKRGDYRQALADFRRSAEQGFAKAESNLGVMYFQGHGVPQNYVKASKWFRLAAAQGYANARHAIGALYASCLVAPYGATPANLAAYEREPFSSTFTAKTLFPQFCVEKLDLLRSKKTFLTDGFTADEIKSEPVSQLAVREAMELQKEAQEIPQASPQQDRLYTIVECYTVRGTLEQCNLFDASAQPFDSQAGCLNSIKTLYPQIAPVGNRYFLNPSVWLECASRPDNRWRVP